MPPKPIAAKSKAVGAAASSSTSRPAGSQTTTKRATQGGANAAAKTKATSSRDSKMTGSKSSSSSLTAASTNKAATAAQSKRENEAALRIQSYYRMRRARCKREVLARKRDEYEQQMKDLEKMAFVELVKRERAEQERKRLEEEHKKQRKRKMNELKRKFLEAAFDGELDELKDILLQVEKLDDQDGIGRDPVGQNIRDNHQWAVVTCHDANNNTAISEAASGGHPPVIQFLMDLGADCNSRGQFNRTPIYRAAFAGHLNACDALLRVGGDPRLYDDDMQSAFDIASNAEIKTLLTEWDVTQTDQLIAKLRIKEEGRKAAIMQRIASQVDSIQSRIQETEKRYESLTKQLNKAKTELNKRINEHDVAVRDGFEHPELTERAIHDAEFQEESLSVEHAEVRERLALMRMELRDKKKESLSEEAAEDEKDGESLAGMRNADDSIECTIRELDDVILKDVGDRLADSPKWPIIIDPSKQATTFLLYRDTNCLTVLDPRLWQDPNVCRLALLGSIRFGKPLLFDLMDMPHLFENFEKQYDAVQPGLMLKILDKSIVKPDHYETLIKKEDGDQYNRIYFDERRIRHFKVIVTCNDPVPSEELLASFLPIWIKLNANN